MPKVLRILNRFNVGGPTYNAAYLTKYLAPEFETILIGGDREEDEESSSFMTDELGIKPIIMDVLTYCDGTNDYLDISKKLGVSELMVKKTIKILQKHELIK